MARYINADALMKKLNEDPIGQTIVQRYNIDGFIEAFPTADVAEVKHGEWKVAMLDHESMGCRPKLHYCSVCNHITTFRTFFCPNCGADMRKESGTE